MALLPSIPEPSACRQKSSTFNFIYHIWTPTQYDVIRLISKDFEISRNSLYIFQTPFLRHCTSNDVYAIIQAHRLNHYYYNGQGSGCLTWTMRLIQVLIYHGLIDPSSYIGFNMKVAEARNSSLYWVPDEGGAQFY